MTRAAPDERGDPVGAGRKPQQAIIVAIEHRDRLRVLLCFEHGRHRAARAGIVGLALSSARQLRMIGAQYAFGARVAFFSPE